MAWFNRDIAVAFVDEASGTEFARSNIPVDKLPDTFEIDTTLHLGETDWIVVGAEPSFKAAFSRTRKLTIGLRKIETMDPREIAFSQLDVTERFDDDKSLKPEDWIETTPLNRRIPDPVESGLPSVDADCDQIYRIASAMSELRESIPIQGDGVYCPICHIANIEIEKLRTPCPRCGRELLKFGWT